MDEQERAVEIAIIGTKLDDLKKLVSDKFEEFGKKFDSYNGLKITVALLEQRVCELEGKPKAKRESKLATVAIATVAVMAADIILRLVWR